MVNENKKTRWDFIGKEAEPESERQSEEQPRIEAAPARPADYTKEQLWDFYEKLPDDLQEAVFSEEIGQVCRDLAQKSGFPNHETKLLRLLGYHLLGTLPRGKFKDRIKQDLQLNDQSTEMLFREVSQVILEPYRRSLDEIYNKGEDKQEVEKEMANVDTGVVRQSTYWLRFWDAVRKKWAQEPESVCLTIYCWVLSIPVAACSILVMKSVELFSFVWWIALLLLIACVPGIIVVVFTVGFCALIIAAALLVLGLIVALVQYFIKHPW
jgi:hypothetical protein